MRSGRGGQRGLTFEYCLITAGTSLTGRHRTRFSATAISSRSTRAGTTTAYIAISPHGIVGEPDAELQDLLGEIDLIQMAAPEADPRRCPRRRHLRVRREPLRKSRFGNSMEFVAHGMGLISHEARASRPGSHHPNPRLRRRPSARNRAWSFPSRRRSRTRVAASSARGHRGSHGHRVGSVRRWRPRMGTAPAGLCIYPLKTNRRQGLRANCTRRAHDSHISRTSLTMSEPRTPPLPFGRAPDLSPGCDEALSGTASCPNATTPTRGKRGDAGVMRCKAPSPPTKIRSPRARGDPVGEGLKARAWGGDFSLLGSDGRRDSFAGAVC